MDTTNSPPRTSNSDGATRIDSPLGHGDELSNIHEHSPRQCHLPSTTVTDISVANICESDSASTLLDSLSLDHSTSSVDSIKAIKSSAPQDSVHGSTAPITIGGTGASITSSNELAAMTELHFDNPSFQVFASTQSKDVVVDISTFQRSRSPSLSSLFNPSPRIKSGDSDAECADHESLGCETSDSTSVEIISACLDDSFVAGRFNLSIRREAPVSAKSGSPALLSGSVPQTEVASQSDVIDTTSNVDEPLVEDRPTVKRIDSVCSSTGTSQSPTPHPLGSRESCLSPTPGVGPGVSPESVRSSNEMESKPVPPVFSLPRIEADPQNQAGVEKVPTAGIKFSRMTAEEQDAASEDGNLDGFSTNIRTPNVYINGIPPHCPDESLFNLTKAYGTVLSVRTFTRCVGEKMSGYGFVLFATLEAAERCIEDLRTYRNLHPSFSKMVHKIPGTPYASGTITLPSSGSLVSLGSQPLTQGALATIPGVGTNHLQSSFTRDAHTHLTTSSVNEISHHNSANHGNSEPSFREKLDMLSDGRTTNLYMEGLPLSIDEHSLAALVAPGQIVSCRFFKTKLSNPPRMIAFVRLDTRQSAEEVIERLNGRVVRGWNDNGSRIAVRFADTPEQRELRRAERLARGEEEEIGDSNRMTMAQAALLNLRGPELQLQNAYLAHHNISTHSIPDGHTSSHARSNMQGLGFMGPQGAIPHVRPSAKLHGSGQSVSNANVVPLGQLGQSAIRSRQAMTQQIPFQESTSSFLHGGMGTRDHQSRHRRASLSSTESFVTNPDSCVRDFSEHANPYPAVTAEALAAAEQLALLQQQAQLRQLQLMQQQRELANGASHLRPHAQSQLHDQALMPPVNIMSERVAALGGRTNATNRSSVHDVNFSPEIGFGDFVQQHVAKNASLRRGEICNSRNHAQPFGTRSTDLSDDHGSALISPTLTFSSRTPSTLSPATPLLPSSFTTPASAPAIMPTSKLSASGGFKARQPYQSHHHRPSYQIPQSHHRALKAEMRH